MTSTGQIPEQELVRLAQRGDAEARKGLYDINVRYLAAVCSRYVSDSEAVKDVLQESFVKIFQSLDKFTYRRDGSLRAWMTRIVVNESLKHLRGKNAFIFQTDRLPDIEDDADLYDNPPGDAVPAAKIHEFIAGLPLGYRTVFNLYLFEKRSHKEIGKLLGISEMTSASQFHRARALLAARIKEYMKQNADEPRIDRQPSL